MPDDRFTQACIFADINEIGKPLSWCTRHKKHCRVHAVELFTCGWSCKGACHQNMKAGSKKAKVLTDPTQTSNTTVSTYNGMKAYLSTHRPLISILENTDALEDNPNDNSMKGADVVAEHLQDLGFALIRIKVNTRDHGLPHNRIWLFFLVVDLKAREGGNVFTENSEQIFKSFVENFTLTRISPPSLEACVFSKSDPIVMAELNRKISMDDREMDPFRDSWPTVHQQFYQERRVKWGTLARPENYRVTLVCDPQRSFSGLSCLAAISTW